MKSDPGGEDKPNRRGIFFALAVPSVKDMKPNFKICCFLSQNFSL